MDHGPGLSASEKVETSVSMSFALADLYTFTQAVPDRFTGRTTFLGHSDTFDTAWQFVAIADTTDAMAMATRERTLLGRPKAEWNTMDTGTVVGRQIMIAGDVSTFVVADRITHRLSCCPTSLGRIGSRSAPEVCSSDGGRVAPSRCPMP